MIPAGIASVSQSIKSSLTLTLIPRPIRWLMVTVHAPFLSLLLSSPNLVLFYPITTALSWLHVPGKHFFFSLDMSFVWCQLFCEIVLVTCRRGLKGNMIAQIQTQHNSRFLKFHFLIPHFSVSWKKKLSVLRPWKVFLLFNHTSSQDFNHSSPAVADRSVTVMWLVSEGRGNKEKAHH